MGGKNHQLGNSSFWCWLVLGVKLKCWVWCLRLAWNFNKHQTLPNDGSMGLVYFPRFTIKINHSCRWIYRSSHGSVMGLQWRHGFLWNFLGTSGSGSNLRDTDSMMHRSGVTERDSLPSIWSGKSTAGTQFPLPFFKWNVQMESILEGSSNFLWHFCIHAFSTFQPDNHFFDQYMMMHHLYHLESVSIIPQKIGLNEGLWNTLNLFSSWNVPFANNRAFSTSPGMLLGLKMTVFFLHLWDRWEL